MLPLVIAGLLPVALGAPAGPLLRCVEVPATPSPASSAVPASINTAAPVGGALTPSVYQPKPNNIIVLNSCDYPIYVTSVALDASAAVTVNASSTYVEEFRDPDSGHGVSLKICKSKLLGGSPHTQFEYTVVGDLVYYDVSFINCVAGTDATACPGLEGGTKATGGEGCSELANEPNEWNEGMAYFVPENDYKPDAPVEACSPAGGLVFELCAYTSG